MESTISRLRIILGARSKSLQIISLTTLEDLLSQKHVLQVNRHRLIWSTFLLTPYLLLIGGRGGIKMASASTPSVMSERASF